MERSYLRTMSEIREVMAEAAKEIKVGFDLELESLAADALIAGFSIYLPAAKRAHYIPMNYYDAEKKVVVSAFTENEEAELALLVAESINAVTYNGAGDLGRWYYRYGVYAKPVGDAGIVAKMMQLHKFGLKEIATEMGITRTPLKLEDILGRNNYNFLVAPLDKKTLTYCCQDAELAVAVEEAVINKNLKLDKYKNFYTVYQLELDIMPILGRASLQGMPLDMPKFLDTAEQLVTETDQLYQSICEILGRDPENFNVGSSARLSAALFNKPNHKARPLKASQHQDLEMPGLGLDPGAIPETTRGYSVSKDNLESIADQHQVIGDIIEWKEMNHVLTKDLPHVEEWAPNGRVFPNFIQIGEDGTARIYTGDPNVISLSYAVRDAMPPDSERVYVHVDLKAAEPRLAALIFNSPKLLAILESDKDLYKSIYSEMTKVPYEEVTPHQRDVAKVVVLAILYGSMGYSVGRKLKVDQKEARALIGDFKEAFQDLDNGIKKRIDYAKQHGRTYTVLGRIRKLPELFARSSQVKRQGERKAINTACQGSCGDVLKMAIRAVHQKSQEPDSVLNKCNLRLVCPVFDACLFELDEAALQEKEAVERELKEAFEVQVTYQGRKVRMISELGWSKKSWLEAMGKKPKMRTVVEDTETVGSEG